MKTSHSSSSSPTDLSSSMKPEFQWLSGTQKWPTRVLCSESRPPTMAVLEPLSRTKDQASTLTVVIHLLSSLLRQLLPTSGMVLAQTRSSRKLLPCSLSASLPSLQPLPPSRKEKKTRHSGNLLEARVSTVHQRKPCFAPTLNHASSRYQINLALCG